MKIFKNFLARKKMDFSAIQIFISVIAIFCATILTGQTSLSSVTNLYTPIFRTIASDSHTCPVPYSNSFCEKQIEPVRACKIRSKDATLTLNIPRVLMEKPLCSMPTEHSRSADLWKSS